MASLKDLIYSAQGRDQEKEKKIKKQADEAAAKYPDAPEEEGVHEEDWLPSEDRPIPMKDPETGEEHLVKPLLGTIPFGPGTASKTGAVGWHEAEGEKNAKTFAQFIRGSEEAKKTPVQQMKEKVPVRSNPSEQTQSLQYYNPSNASAAADKEKIRVLQGLYSDEALSPKPDKDKLKNFEVSIRALRDPNWK